MYNTETTDSTLLLDMGSTPVALSEGQCSSGGR